VFEGSVLNALRVDGEEMRKDRHNLALKTIRVTFPSSFAFCQSELMRQRKMFHFPTTYFKAASLVAPETF